MIKSLCLVAFNLAVDGHTLVPIAAGDIVDVPEDLVKGLANEGFIGDPEGATQPPVKKSASRKAPAKTAGAGSTEGEGDAGSQGTGTDTTGDTGK